MIIKSRSNFSKFYIPERLKFLLCSKPIKVGDDLLPCGKCFYCREQIKKSKEEEK